MNNTPNKFAVSRKSFAVAALWCCAALLGLSDRAHAQARRPAPSTLPPVKEIQMVAPALEHYTQDLLLGDVWKRPGLSSRDRSIVTIAVLIAKNQPAELPFYLNRALDNGVKPGEIAEIITHLAFYSGWPNAMAAVNAAKPVFAERHVKADQLPQAKVELLPLDKDAENKRATTVEENFGKVAPGVVQYTTDALFRDLWLRPGLAPRDRSMVTVSALVASGQTAQITYHLNRAMDNGLSQEQAGEMLTQMAFYAGWPNVFSAMSVFKEVFAKRPTASNK
jgi:4-carboxymuconolactone decarboxylase